MAKAPAFQFYPSDFLTGTAMFKPEERGAYITLLCIQWEHGGIKDEDFVHLSGLPNEKLGRVRDKFVKCEDGIYRNTRLEETRARQKKFSEQQTKKINKRWNNDTKPIPNSYQTDTALGNTFLEDGDRSMKKEDKENSFEKSEKLFSENGETSLPLEMLKIWQEEKPSYPVDRLKDLPALQGIKEFIVQQANKTRGDPHFHTVADSEILDLWQHLIPEFLKDKFWKNKSLTAFGNSIQEFWNKANKNGNRKDSQKANFDRLEELLGNGGQTRPHAN